MKIVDGFFLLSFVSSSISTSRNGNQKLFFCIELNSEIDTSFVMCYDLEGGGGASKHEMFKKVIREKTRKPHTH